MKASEKLITALKGFESCRLYAYRDSKGVATIGWGHTKNVRMGMAITQKLADAYLVQDINEVETILNKMNLPLKTQGNYDAVLDFLYNVGVGRFNKSTLKKKIIACAPDEEIKTEFKKWIYCGDKPLKGLIKRRAWEASRWSEKD